MKQSTTYILITPSALSQGLEEEIKKRLARKGRNTELSHRREVPFNSTIVSFLTKDSRLLALEHEFGGKRWVVYNVTAPAEDLLNRIKVVVGKFEFAGSLRGDFAGSPQDALVLWPAELGLDMQREQQLYDLLRTFGTETDTIFPPRSYD